MNLSLRKPAALLSVIVVVVELNFRLLNVLTDLFARVLDAITEPEASAYLPITDEESGDAVLIIDCSWSMAETDWKPTRLGGAQEAGKSYCDHLLSKDPKSRVAIVAYGGTAKVYCPLTEVSNIEKLHKAIDAIDYRDATNIRSGLKKAQQLIKNSVRQVQLCVLSDGHNNIPPSPVNIAEALKERATIECIGIGKQSAVDEELMKQIASPTPDGKGKRYRWIGSKERLVKEFQNLAGRIMRS